MQRTLSLPAARLMTTRSEHTLRLGQVERLLASNQLVINGVQRCLSHGAYQVRMRRRPVLFSLLQTLGEHWPAQATREVLIARAFGSLRPNSSHRSRLRVEISRLRTAIRSLAQIQATPDGFKLAAHEGTPIAVLAPPVTGDDAALLALLSDGEAWPTSALALALPTSQRTVQRALTRLVKAGQVHCIGVGRMRRWVAAPAAETSSSWFLATAVVC